MTTTTAQRLTRTEVATAVKGAFDASPPHRDELLATARRNGARCEVVEALAQLAPREFGDLRQVWPALPDMPIK